MDVFSKTWQKSLNVRALSSYKRVHHGHGREDGNGQDAKVNAEHTRKDTSRQNRDPPSSRQGRGRVRMRGRVGWRQREGDGIEEDRGSAHASRNRTNFLSVERVDVDLCG